MESSQPKPRLLITGISGFLGSWVTKKALDSKKYIVRGTIRDTKNQEKINCLKEAFGDQFEKIELFEADLEDYEAISKAVEDCDFIIHTASPVPMKSPKKEEEVIKPAIKGNENILKACIGSKVKKVVITSSALTITDHSKGSGVVDETHFTEESKKMNAYSKSKIRAEAFAFDFMKNLSSEERTFEMCTIHPAFILGPVLFKNSDSASIQVIKKMLNGKLGPGLPKVYAGHTDVRDCADAHLIALQKGRDLERYSPNSGTHAFKEIALTISKEFKTKGYKIKTKELNKCFMKLGAIFNKDARYFLSLWDIKVEVDNRKIREEFGLKFIGMEKSVIDMCYSLV